MSDPWCEMNYCDRQDLLAEVKAKDAEIKTLTENMNLNAETAGKNATALGEAQAEIARLREALEWVIGYGCPEKIEKRISAAIAKARGE